MREEQERRKRFFPTISLGSVLSIITFIAGAAGIYANLYADVSTSKSEIRNIKVDMVKKEQADRDLKQELKADVKEVKEDVKTLGAKVDRILFEMRENARRN